MAGTRAALGLFAGIGAVAVLVSGGSGADPRTPPALPGLPPPFLGIAVIGSGEVAAAVDAYGDVVDRRVPGPAGLGLIDNPADRQAAGSVPSDTGVVTWMSVSGRSIPFWRADSVSQRYLPRTNVLVTVAHLDGSTTTIVRSIGGPAAARADRRWVARARPLGDGAPGWARRMYVRSLLVLRALTDRRTGAVAAGIRDGWAYVWPRDASTVAIALSSAGYRAEARRVIHFLRGLDLEAAARFHGDGAPVDGRAAQGDALGWVAAAARAAGLPSPADSSDRRGHLGWQGRADYQEGPAGAYLANAIASTPADGPKSRLYLHFSAHRRGVGGIRGFFGTGGLLTRQAGDPDSGVDSAVAWAVRPFPHPALFPLVRRSLHRLVARREGRFGIVPSENWPGNDPWTAPTVWTAWSLAALSGIERQSGERGAAGEDRRQALRLMGDLRRAATPAGLLPERVDVHTGIPRSTTPLAWSHAFAILAIRTLWP